MGVNRELYELIDIMTEGEKKYLLELVKEIRKREEIKEELVIVNKEKTELKRLVYNQPIIKSEVLSKVKKLVNKIERLYKRVYEASISNLYSDSYLRDFSRLNSGLIDITKKELFDILDECSITSYKEYLEYFGEENESIILEKLFLK